MTPRQQREALLLVKAFARVQLPTHEPRGCQCRLHARAKLLVKQVETSRKPARRKKA